MGPVSDLATSPPAPASARTCPECHEPVAAGIVRHQVCFQAHQASLYGYTERMWRVRHLARTYPMKEKP